MHRDARAPMRIALLASVSIPRGQLHQEVSVFLEDCGGKPQLALQRWQSPRCHLRVGPWIWINYRGLWMLLQLMSQRIYTFTTPRYFWKWLNTDGEPTTKSPKP